MKIITVIDTGITSYYANNILKEKVISKITCRYNTEINRLIIQEGADDEIGHGTMVCSAIHMVNKNVQYRIIKMCGESFWANEDTLYLILKYIINDNQPTDIIHISCGLQICERIEELNKILYQFKQKGIVIVAAFSNNQVISYPAACDYVIGVAYNIDIISPKEWWFIENSPINIYATGNPQNLISKDGKIKKTAGSSFAAAFISGHIAKMLDEVTPDIILDKLKEKASKVYKIPEFKKIEERINANKIVIFPFNKENHSIIRNINLLNCQLKDILELKYSPYIGKNAFELLSISNYDICLEENKNVNWIIKDLMSYNWNSDFDTFILGHIEQLDKVLPFSLYDYIFEHCIQYKKNLYSYGIVPDNIISLFKQNNLQCFYPKLIDNYIGHYNCGMLYEISKPVIGVFGTSSKQGKWSLQLKIHEIFKERGYNIGHLGTEPNALLFQDTEICAIGYNAIVDLDYNSIIPVFNYLMHKLELNNDLLIFGTQSNLIPITFGGLATIPTYSHELILACEPQASILCINEWDDIDYIIRCIKYLESFCENKVIGLSYYFKDFYEQWNEQGLSIHELQYDYTRIKNIENLTGLNAYDMNNKAEIEMLCDEIINYFCNEN